MGRKRAPTLAEALSMYFSVDGVEKLKRWRRAGVVNVGLDELVEWPPHGELMRVVEDAIRTGRDLYTRVGDKRTRACTSTTEKRENGLSC